MSTFLSKIFAFTLTGFVLCFSASGQNKKPIVVDRSGVLRWTDTGEEAAFFGVNYTVPFAYGYRSHKAIGIDLEKAIDTDVAHMARLQFDAFRVHVWDTEISDSAGNLLENEHLRLFDYLLMRLKQRGIKILITPLAFWGNGYPEPDQNTGSFSSRHNKRQVLVTPEAIAAQENYLKQFFRHVNPYTKTTYGNDPDVVAMEINNEPHHSGPAANVTAYINRMANAIRSTGWTKPVFYNISESPTYAGAVVQAKVDGHSFQWYPTGLVANRTLEGNFLPNVDRYRIPFLDSLPLFRTRARMVYEFDAGDVIGSYMYPAMARAFRQAGFQWATQFAYDPLYTAHANTEYQTHYVNLAYTPGKAISLMIAGKAFHQLPRGKDFGTYPADTLFGAFRVSYAEDLSEMNTPSEYYYSNHTQTKPADAAALLHVAGVGNSPVVQYTGTGAYFLDRQQPGVWRLEVLPDVFQLADPFGKAAPWRTVRRLLAEERLMRLNLPDLDLPFTVQPVGGTTSTESRDGAFRVRPGVYTLVRSGTNWRNTGTVENGVSYPVYSFPSDSILFDHQPAITASAGTSWELSAQIAGADSAFLEWRLPGGWKTIGMQRRNGFLFTASLPAEWMVPGKQTYRLLLRDRNGNTHTFPGNTSGNPYRWDAGPEQTYTIMVLPPAAPWVLFDAAADATRVNIINANWQKNRLSYPTSNEYPHLWQELEWSGADTAAIGWQLPLDRKLAASIHQYTKLAIRVKGTPGARLKLLLVDAYNQVFGSTLTIPSQEAQWLEVPLYTLMVEKRLLLPRPYPGFQPLFLGTDTGASLSPANLDMLQLYALPMPGGANASVQLQTILLQ